jgi:hypothetical protein
MTSKRSPGRWRRAVSQAVTPSPSSARSGRLTPVDASAQSARAISSAGMQGARGGAPGRNA